MFQGFSQATVDFMWNLRFNNRKPWFEEHKQEFQQVLQTPMKALANEVCERVIAKYPDKGLSYRVSRIYKDARRLHGDGPYRDHLWFSMEKNREEWAFQPVFWFELHPEQWSYGLGYYRAKPITMQKLRVRIDKSPKNFEKLILPLEKQQEFHLEGEEYRRPKVAPTPKTQEWFNKKSLSLIHSQELGEEILSGDLAARLIKGYEFLMPYYDYLSSLDNDPDPVK